LKKIKILLLLSLISLLFVPTVSHTFAQSNGASQTNKQELSEKAKKSAEKLDKLVLKLRKAHNNDWGKIDKILSTKGFKVVKSKANIPENAIAEAQDLETNDLKVTIRVYKDMNSSFYHVRGYYDWTSEHYSYHGLGPDNGAGIYVYGDIISVIDNTEVLYSYDNDWDSYNSALRLEQQRGDGNMAVAILEDWVNFNWDYNAYHGVFGYSIENPGKTVAFSTEYIFAWSGGSLESVQVSYPAGVTATYSSSTSQSTSASGSVTIDSWEWGSIDSSGLDNDNQS
jgi:hypothetical protein